MTRLLLLITLASTLLAHGQSPTGGPLKVRFLAERSPGNLGQVLLVVGESRGKPFDLPVNQLSDPIDAPGRAFGLRAMEKDVALANISLPEKGKSFIILLIPATEGGYKHVVIASDDTSFSPGDVYLYNHANKTVLGFVGTSKFVLEPATGKILRPAGAKPERYYDVGIGVREPEGDRMLSTTRWPEDKMMRNYVFFFVNPKTQRVDFRAVDEFITKEKPQSDSP
jgi:hypothetical protein